MTKLITARARKNKRAARRGACSQMLAKTNRYSYMHSRPQRPRSFWSAPRIATSGPVQRHSGFEWLCKHNILRPEPIRFVKLFSEHAQSDGKSVNRGLPLFDLVRGRDSWCCLKESAASGDENVLYVPATQTDSYRDADYSFN